MNQRSERAGVARCRTAGSSAIEPAVLAAIVAAVEATWPQAAPAEPVVELAEPARWRFSRRRWWTQAAASRLRPW